MGVECTDRWLEKDFYAPQRMCREIFSPEEGAERLYPYLRRFGMYRPGRMAMKTLEALLEQNIWRKAEKIYDHYKKQWNGPDVPVYIFPKSSYRNEMEPAKSGVSFKDKMFLFLTELESEKELEALIVHEFHHVCRMNSYQKELQEYTLLDSLIIEGLAEFAVTKCCGPEFNAKWTSAYEEEDLSFYWKRYVKDNLTIKRTHPLHDKLLYGMGRYPELLGYAIGYHFVMKQKESKTWTMEDSFILKPEEMSFPF